MRRAFATFSRPRLENPEPAVLLTVVVPTYNERPNIRALVNRLAAVLGNIAYEVVFVDDNSPDGTADEVRLLAASDTGIRVIQRIGRRGLASACMEGMLASAAPYIAVMDADMQHDESILPEMLRRIRDEQLDLVVGSRHVSGGSMGQFSKRRVMLSQFGRTLSGLVTRCKLTDPMSGYFILNRGFLDEVTHSVSAIGFKILIDLIASSPRPVRLVELPYVFRSRQQELSKMDMNAGLEYILLLAEKLVGDAIPIRAVLIACALAAALAAYLATLLLFVRVGHWPIGASVFAIGLLTIFCQFAIYNCVTFRDRRVSGFLWWRNGSCFAAVSLPGILGNSATVGFLIQSHVSWALSAVIGCLLFAAWNYVVASLLSWRRYR